MDDPIGQRHSMTDASQPLNERDALSRVPVPVLGLRANTLAILAGGICLVALWGWITGFDALTRLVPGLPSMKVNTGLAFLLLSISTWRLSCGRTRWPLVGAPIALCLAFLTLWQSLWSVNLHIDNLLMQDLGTPDALHPGRMSVATSLAVILLSISMLQLRARQTRFQHWRYLPTYAALAISYLASVGFLLGVQWTGWTSAVLGSLSLPTSTVVLLLGLALLHLGAPGPAMRPATGVQSTTAFRFLKVALPFSLLLPAALGWLREVLVRQGALGSADAQAIALTLMGMAFGLLTLLAAFKGGRIEASLLSDTLTLHGQVAQRPPVARR
jgi:hypothetical protein